MKREEIRRGIRSIIQATVKEAANLEAEPKKAKTKVKERKSVKSEAIRLEKRLESVSLNIPKIEIKKNGQIRIKSHYYPLPNDFIDKIAINLEPGEEIIYNRLYRLSWGWSRSTCRVSAQGLKNMTRFNSLTTVRKALKGLIEKKYIIPLTNEKKKSYDNQEGSFYRVLLPHEILLGKTHEGITIEDIPKSGLPESILPEFDTTIFDRTEIDLSENDTTLSAPNDIPKNDITECDISSRSFTEDGSRDTPKNDIT